MDLTDIARIRMQNQQITPGEQHSVRELVRWMGAMQAQDYNMVKWAFGVRIPGETDSSVEAAIGRGDIIRTHLLRPTWHMVAAEDVYWLLDLSAPQIRKQFKTRHRQLSITPKLSNKVNDIIVNELSNGEHLHRSDLIAALEKAKIETGGNRASHFFMLAELEGLICSGRSIGKKQTFALLPERVPRKKLLSREEALVELAKRYFSSHGPAQLEDFKWWSGLTLTDARKALDMVNSELKSVEVDGQTYWLAAKFAAPYLDEDQVFLLPAFDEFIISYADRSASILTKDQQSVISKNGIFYPMIMINGVIKGTWKRTIKGKKVVIELKPFEKLSKKQMGRVEEQAFQFGKFLGKEVAVIV